MRLKTWHLDDHSHCCHRDEALSLECDCLVRPFMLPALRLCFCRAPTSTFAFVSKAFLWDFPSLACQSASCPRPRSPLHSEGCLAASIQWLLGSQVLPISDPKYFEQWHLSWACTDFSCHCFQTVMSFLKHLQCFRDDLRTWKAVHSVCKYYAIVFEGFEQLQIWEPCMCGYWQPTKISLPVGSHGSPVPFSWRGFYAQWGASVQPVSSVLGAVSTG